MTSEINTEQRWDINSVLLQIKNEIDEKESKVEKVSFTLLEDPMIRHSKHGICYNGIMQIPIRDAEEMVAKLQIAIDDFYKFDAEYVDWCAKQDVSNFLKNGVKMSDEEYIQMRKEFARDISNKMIMLLERSYKKKCDIEKRIDNILLTVSYRKENCRMNVTIDNGEDFKDGKEHHYE